MFPRLLRAHALLGAMVLSACGSTPEPAAEPAAAAHSEAPGPAAEAAPKATMGAVDVAGLKAAMDAGEINLIDVRTPDEYAEGHVPGATLLPLQDLGSRMSELEPLKDKPVYLICAVGGRSSAATKALAQAGFSEPINVEGGTKAWVAAGYPVEK